MLCQQEILELKCCRRRSPFSKRHRDSRGMLAALVPRMQSLRRRAHVQDGSVGRTLLHFRPSFQVLNVAYSVKVWQI